MTRWGKGEAVIEGALRAGDLQKVEGSAAAGGARLEAARVRLRSAERVLDEDPAGALTLAYDAARLACTGLLAQQGLRPTTQGGHKVVQDAMRAQFGDAFTEFDWLRRRRNEVENPSWPGDHVDESESLEALTAARRIIANADRLIDELGFFLH